MLAEERRKQILVRLARTGQVLSAELVRDFAVSEDTIRRDLKEMAEAGLLKKVHGGAMSSTTVPYNYKARKNLNLDAKSAISERAVDLLHDKMLIFVDGSTTVAQLRHHIPKDIRTTFVTHSVATAAAFGELPQAEVILLGGRVIPDLLITSGPQLVEQAKQFRPDLTIIGVHGLTTTAGATVENYDDALIKQEFIRNSAETAILAGQEKLGFVGAYFVAKPSEIDYLVSDADPEQLKPFSKIGMTVWTV